MPILAKPALRRSRNAFGRSSTAERALPFSSSVSSPVPKLAWETLSLPFEDWLEPEPSSSEVQPATAVSLLPLVPIRESGEKTDAIDHAVSAEKTEQALGVMDLQTRIPSSHELVKQLSREVRQLETSRRQVGVWVDGSAAEGEHASPGPIAPTISSGSAALDSCLPHGGYERGTLIEYVQTNRACGATYLALSAARSALSAADGFCVVVDGHGQFYPPAAAAMGIDLKRLVIVRPESLKDRLWAIDRSLRCPAIVAVVAEVEHLDDHTARRFQLAAERGGGLGLLVRGLVACRQPSWADVQWLVQSCRHSHSGSSVASANVSTVAHSSMRTSPLKHVPDYGNQNRLAHEDRQVELELKRVRGGEAGAKVRLAIRASDGSLQTTSTRMLAQRTLAQEVLTKQLASLSKPATQKLPTQQHRTA